MLYPEEAQRNLQSIDAVPLAVLPAGLARDVLLAITAAGYDVYAYQGASLNGKGVWNLWSSDLAEARRHLSRNGRVPVSEWITNWRTLIAEAHLSVSVEVRP
jgi:hypothetical protein